MVISSLFAKFNGTDKTGNSPAHSEVPKYYIQEGWTVVTTEKKPWWTEVRPWDWIKQASDGSLRHAANAPELLLEEKSVNIAELYKQQQEEKNKDKHEKIQNETRTTKANQQDQAKSLLSAFLSEGDVKQINTIAEGKELLTKLSPNAEILKNVRTLDNQLYNKLTEYTASTKSSEEKSQIVWEIRDLRSKKQSLIQQELTRLTQWEIEWHTLAPLSTSINTKYFDAQFNFKPWVSLDMKKLWKKHRVNNIISSINMINTIGKWDKKNMSEEWLHRVLSYRKNHDRWIGSAAVGWMSYVKNIAFKKLMPNREDKVIQKKFSEKKELISQTLVENWLAKSHALHTKVMARIEAYRQMYIQSRIESLRWTK